MGRYFDYREMKDFDVSRVVQTLSMIENDAHLILENTTKHRGFNMPSNEDTAGRVRAKYDFVPVETHQILCYLGMRDANV